MISKIINIRNKWRNKYNSLCVKYADLSDKRITELEKDREILLENIQLKKDIDKLKETVNKYKRRFGKLKGGEVNDKNKNR